MTRRKRREFKTVDAVLAEYLPKHFAQQLKESQALEDTGGRQLAQTLLRKFREDIRPVPEEV
jgi:hypothetical protein